MKIIEARDGFINFEADESVYLSSFIQAAGMDKTYIAQVNQMKKFGKIVIASARILFIYDGEKLIDYDRTLPSRDSEITVFPLEVIQNSIKAENPVIVAKSLDDSKNIFMDLSAFNKKTLISVDSNEMNNTLVSNLTKQFGHLGQKTLVIDTLGIIKGEKYIAGRNFKMPLDTSALEFMYKSCLNDATDDSKSIIAEVFKDLSEYSETVPFVPFGVLKSIVDDMVDKQHIFKLFILKNRLANFEKLGFFATEQSEVENLDKILSSNFAIIDLSKLSSLFQNRFIEYIYTKLDNKGVQVLFEASNTVSKKNLKNVIVDSSVSTTLITHSKFQYLNNIKDLFKNYIIEPTVLNKELFKVYCTFLSSMQEGMYLIAGESINFIPMVSKIQDIEETMEAKEEIAQTQPESESEEENFEEVAADIIQEDSALVEPEENQIQEESLTQEEIIAEIEEKSNNVIENISENIVETAEIDLFGDEETEESDDIEPTEEIQEIQEIQDEPVEASEEVITQESEEGIEENDSSEDIIESEYEDVVEMAENTDGDNLDIIEAPVDVPINEENITEFDIDSLEDNLSDDNSEVNDDMVESLEETDLQTDDELAAEEMTEVVEDIPDIQEDMIPAEYDNSTEQDDEVLLSEMSDDISIIDEEPSLNDFEEDTAIELSGDEELLLNDVSSEEEETDEQVLDIAEEDFSEPSIMPLEADDYIQNNEDAEEYSEEDVKDDDIIIDMTEDDDIGIDEDVDRQIVEDVDKVFTTIRTEDAEEEISDSDLDLIDALNSDEDEELEEYHGELKEVSDSQIDEGILEQPSESIIPPRQPHSENNEILEKKESNTPIVPVYDADIPQEDMVVSDSIQQGDSVVHAKYGNGVVEKMIKYGTKTLFSINFENLGRRLLDPTLTEIKKL